MDERRTELAKLIGKQASRRRAELGLSQEKVSRKMDMSRETVRAVEMGRNLPDLVTLEKLAHALDMSLPHLLGWDGRTLRMSSKGQGRSARVLAHAAA